MNPVFQEITAINRETNEITVKSSKGKYLVKASPDMESHVQNRSVVLGDYAKVVKSSVSGEWVMVDYQINTAMYADTDCVVTGDEPDYSISTLEDWL